MRRSALLVVSLIAIAVFGWQLPLPKGDAFRVTLPLVPVVVVALAEIARSTRRRGGRPLRSGAVAAELAVAAGLVVLVIARPHLPLPPADEVIAAGFVLLLAHHVTLQLLAMRPLLGRRLPDRPSALFFWLPLTVYLALLPWSTAHRPPDGDEPWYLLVTHSLAYDFDAELTNNYAERDWRHFLDRAIEPQPGDPRGPHGEIYSRHNELLPVVLAPAYRLGGKLGALAAMAGMAAALAWATLRLARHYAPTRPGEALAAYALLAFTPPLLVYSYQVWVEVPAALLSVLALDAVLERRDRPLSAWRGWLAIGLPILFLPLLKIRFMLLAGPLLALAWWHSGRSRRALLLLALLLAALGGAILAHNLMLYGNPLKIHSWQEVELQQYGPHDYLRGLTGLLWDDAFGLFSCAPIWLLLLPATALLLARWHPLLLDLGVFVLPYLLIVSPRKEWYGGWSPPFRYALVALPLLALASIPLLERRRQAGAKALLAALGALTLALTLLWVAVPGWTYDFAHGRTHLLDLLELRLGTDLARFFPSYVRFRTASWWWPPLSIALTCFLWWFPRRPRRGAPLWGVTALLAASACLPALAAKLPTTTIELEDPWVIKTGGHLFPDLWVIERTRYRGGWVLREGEQAEAPIVTGGSRVELDLWSHFVRHHPGPLTLEVLAGRTPVATLDLHRPKEWREHSLGPFDWPRGAPLVLRVRSRNLPGQPNGVVLDRVDLHWR